MGTHKEISLWASHQPVNPAQGILISITELCWFQKWVKTILWRRMDDTLSAFVLQLPRCIVYLHYFCCVANRLICCSSCGIAEFALQAQHETSSDSGIPLISDTPKSNISRKRPRSLSLVTLNSNDWEEYWETTVIPKNGFSTKSMKLEQCIDWDIPSKKDIAKRIHCIIVYLYFAF